MQQQFSLLHLAHYYSQRLNFPNPQYATDSLSARARITAPPPAPSPLPEATLSTGDSIVQRLNLHCFRESSCTAPPAEASSYYQHHLDCLPTLGSLRLPRRYFSARRYRRRNRVLLILLILLLGGRTRVVRVRLFYRVIEIFILVVLVIFASPLQPPLLLEAN
ncbi:hypothetical protein O9993_21390 [Vibrio lentus]|nr:hypothetical protein [Vibrio lentus]